jgi:hypothetical protein
MCFFDWGRMSAIAVLGKFKLMRRSWTVFRSASFRAIASSAPLESVFPANING